MNVSNSLTICVGIEDFIQAWVALDLQKITREKKVVIPYLHTNRELKCLVLKREKNRAKKALRLTDRR